MHRSIASKKPPVSPKRKENIKENVGSPKFILKELPTGSGRAEFYAHKRHIEDAYKASFYSKRCAERTDSLPAASSSRCYRYQSKSFKIRTVRSWNNSPVQASELPNLKVSRINSIIDAANLSSKSSRQLREGINTLSNYCSSERILKELNIRYLKEPKFNYL